MPSLRRSAACIQRKTASRCANTFFDGTVDAASFFVGATLLDDVRMSVPLCESVRPLVLGGSEPLKTVFGILLRYCVVSNIIEVPSDVADVASNIGARMVYE